MGRDGRPEDVLPLQTSDYNIGEGYITFSILSEGGRRILFVYVLNKYGKPLMPCQPRKARILLRDGKAKVIQREPFTIQLLYGSSGYKQKVSLGIDAGSNMSELRLRHRRKSFMPARPNCVVRISLSCYRPSANFVVPAGIAKHVIGNLVF